MSWHLWRLHIIKYLITSQIFTLPGAYWHLWARILCFINDDWLHLANLLQNAVLLQHEVEIVLKFELLWHNAVKHSEYVPKRAFSLSFPTICYCCFSPNSTLNLLCKVYVTGFHILQHFATMSVMWLFYFAKASGEIVMMCIRTTVGLWSPYEKSSYVTPRSNFNCKARNLLNLIVSITFWWKNSSNLSYALYSLVKSTLRKILQLPTKQKGSFCLTTIIIWTSCDFTRSHI